VMFRELTANKSEDHGIYLRIVNKISGNLQVNVHVILKCYSPNVFVVNKISPIYGWLFHIMSCNYLVCVDNTFKHMSIQSLYWYIKTVIEWPSGKIANILSTETTTIFRHILVRETIYVVLSSYPSNNYITSLPRRWHSQSPG
jgi:hypothetical protein